MMPMHTQAHTENMIMYKTNKNKVTSDEGETDG